MRDYFFPQKKSDHAIFLDRDGTINIDIVMAHKPSDLKFFPDTIDALHMLSKLNAYLIIVTNQSGIGKGIYTKKEMSCFHRRMVEILISNGICIDAIYYCPYIDDNKNRSFCKKPNPGMLIEASLDLRLDLRKCFIIGDKMSDIEAGENAHIYKKILVTTGIYERGVDFEIGESHSSPDYIAPSLLNAATYVLEHHP